MVQYTFSRIIYWGCVFCCRGVRRLYHISYMVMPSRIVTIMNIIMNIIMIMIMLTREWGRRRPAQGKASLWTFPLSNRGWNNIVIVNIWTFVIVVNSLESKTQNFLKIFSKGSIQKKKNVYKAVRLTAWVDPPLPRSGQENVKISRQVVIFGVILPFYNVQNGP